MKHCPVIRAILVLSFIMVGIGLYAQTLYVVNSQSRTLSSINLETDNVNNSFAMLGNIPNKIVVDESYIWSVNSGDNSIQKISRTTGQSLQNILVAIGSNPWDAIKHGDYLYVSGLVSGKVYKIDTITSTTVANLQIGPASEALLVVGSKLYVTNAGNYSQNYAGSSVSVIDLDSFSLMDTIPVHANPQYLAELDGMLYVGCTGNWTDLGGAIAVIDTSTDTLVQTIDMGGTPSSIWIKDSGLAYVGDSNGINLYSFDPTGYQLLHGADNPLSPGGSEIVGNSDMIALLVPNWSGNGSIKILHHDLSLWKQFTVAMMPTDLKLWIEPSSNNDDHLPAPSVQVYPNPARSGSKLEFHLGTPIRGELQIYNLRGQLVQELELDTKSSISLQADFPSGIYYYRLIQPNRTLHTGRFAITR